MSNITVSYAEIEQAPAQLAQGQDEIAARLRAMRQRIQQLGSSGFVTDRASVAFTESFDAYTASADAVIAKLGEIRAFLAQAAGALRDMDAQIAARIR